MTTREDVMTYSTIGAVMATLFAGGCFDAGAMGLAASFGVVAFGCIAALFLTYLDTPTKD